VALAVLILLGFRYLVGGSQSPDYFLKQLDSDNAEIRWRGASDLAQILKRPESLALRADATFALDLADRLEAALNGLDDDEKSIAERIKNLPAADQERMWRKLAPQRHHAEYLAAALGDFVVPVGAPLLCRMALHDTNLDLKGNTLQRRKAVWALGNLGDNIRSFKTMPAEAQTRTLELLRKEAAGKMPRTGWARTALYYLDKKEPLSPKDVVEVDRVLAGCARAEDRFLRLQVALVLNFWDSSLVEPTLLQLAHDDGHGTLIADEERNDGR
jgi:hypothetical protein